MEMNAAVKGFGEMMVHDHSGGNSQVKILAAAAKCHLTLQFGREESGIERQAHETKRCCIR